MKKMLALMVSAVLCLMPMSVGAAQDNYRVVTSFYPMYLLTINIAGGIDGVEVSNMAEQNVGCLHDYSLRTGDMRMIHSADVFIVNGAGMESFTDKVLSEQDIPVITASEGIELIDGDEHAHDEHEEAEHSEDENSEDARGHNHEEETNAHIWMSPRLAQVQVENIAQGLIEFDPAHAAEYRANADAYIEKLKALDAEVSEMLSGVQGARIVTSHPAFEYFARDYGIDIVASLGQEPGEMPRTHDMAELVNTVRDMDIRALFVEKAYSEKAAGVLARETGISIYTLDSLTSGALTNDAYENGIRADALVLKEALSNGNT